MIKIIFILFLGILLSRCAMLENINKAVLDGQKWSIVNEIGPGTGSGNSWIFLPGNRFKEQDWYSGGAYWIHHYTGTYVYDADRKTVFLNYDRHPYLKHISKKRLDLKITEKDTVLTVTEGWKKPIERPSNSNHNLKIHGSVFRNYTVKIEK